MPTLSDNATRLLVRLVAKADGLHIPFREVTSPAWAHISLALDAYRQTGAIPWAADQGQAKADEAALGELQRAKLVSRLRLRGATQKTSDVAIRPAGFEMAGTLIGTARRNTALLATACVAETSFELTGRRDAFVAEIEFSRPRGAGWGDGKQAEIGLTQEWQQAALTAGWTRFNCSFSRWGAYAATTFGLRAIDAAAPDELICVADPPADEALRELYLAERDAAMLAWRAKADPINDIGRIPLSGSGGPDRGGFAMGAPATEAAHA